MMCKSCVGLLVVALSAGPALGGLMFFDSQDDFELFNLGAGKLLKGIENFEEGGPGPGGILSAPGPLCGGIPHDQLGYPDGLENLNFCIETSPVRDVVVIGADFLGPGLPNSTVAGANTFTDVTHMYFVDDRKTAVGFDVMDPIFAAGCQIDVFGIDGVPLGGTTWPCNVDKTFFGVWSPTPIGFIDIQGVGDGSLNGAELVDNVQMWRLPEPSSIGLLALSAVWLIRRR